MQRHVGQWPTHSCCRFVARAAYRRPVVVSARTRNHVPHVPAILALVSDRASTDGGPSPRLVAAILGRSPMPDSLPS